MREESLGRDGRRDPFFFPSRVSAPRKVPFDADIRLSAHPRTVLGVIAPVGVYPEVLTRFHAAGPGPPVRTCWSCHLSAKTGAYSSGEIASSRPSRATPAGATDALPIEKERLSGLARPGVNAIYGGSISTNGLFRTAPRSILPHDPPVF